MKTLEFTTINDCRISIPVNKITGFTETHKSYKSMGNCFISTGADNENGGENGWYVKEKYECVRTLYELSLHS